LPFAVHGFPAQTTLTPGSLFYFASGGGGGVKIEFLYVLQFSGVFKAKPIMVCGCCLSQNRILFLAHSRVYTSWTACGAFYKIIPGSFSFIYLFESHIDSQIIYLAAWPAR